MRNYRLAIIAVSDQHLGMENVEKASFNRFLDELGKDSSVTDLVLLGDVVDMVVELTGAEMAEHHVQVMCQLEPAVVRADGEMLRQALLNLMLNGMQAMKDGGRLKVQVRRERDEAVIEVADEGEGIPRDVLPKIFDLYFTTKAKGSGIGLAMTYRIVQMHGGSMDVQSA